jgi:hypothetical protein
VALTVAPEPIPESKAVSQVWGQELLCAPNARAAWWLLPFLPLRGSCRSFRGGRCLWSAEFLRSWSVTCLPLPLGIYCQRGGHRWPPCPLVFSPTNFSTFLSPPSPKLSPWCTAAGKMVATASSTSGTHQSPQPRWTELKGSCPQALPSALGRPIPAHGASRRLSSSSRS